MIRIALSVGVLVGVCIPSLVQAHTVMMSPSPRNNDDGLKSGPCGGVAPTASPTVFEAGETITVEFLETVDHPGWYRVAWSSAGDGEFEDNVLQDDIPDEACGVPPCAYSVQVTLPDEDCQGCALQLIQYMTEGATPSLYYSCADVDLVARASEADAGQGGSTLEPDAGMGEGGGIPQGEEGAMAGPVMGGCGVSSSTSGMPALFLLVAALFVARSGRLRPRA